jgi:S1-C subfamily serine protease
MSIRNATLWPLAVLLLAGCSNPPRPPANLTVSPTGPRALTLTWQEGGGEERGYRVERTGGATPVEVATLPANTTRYEVKDLDPKRNYTFRVVALGKGKHEAAGAESGATTLALSLEDAVAAAKPSVVLVRNKRVNFFSSTNSFSFGTGFAIAGGRVVTNHHVVQGASEVALRLDGSWYKAEVLASDETNDLAILSVDNPLPPALKLAEADAVREGSALVAIGFPKVDDLANDGFDLGSSIAPGTLTAFRERKKDTTTNFLGVPLAVTCKLIQMDCPINPGNSGGPVLDVGSGLVVGVTVSRLADSEGIKFAVPVNYLRELTARLETAPLSGGGETSLFGNRPSLFGNRPSLFGNQPSFLSNSPFLSRNAP